MTRLVVVSASGNKSIVTSLAKVQGKLAFDDDAVISVVDFARVKVSNNKVTATTTF